ncbi:MAG TPA: hypothetical protein VGI95_05140 [Caulobacteraceae bacterium]|jgi:hypothetical protein
MSSAYRTALAFVAVAGVLGAVLPTAEAGPTTHSDNACITMGHIQNTKMASPRVLLVRADGGHTFRIGFASDCNSAASFGVVMHPFDNSGQVCQPLALDISVRDTGERCIANSLSRLSDEEVAALPPRLRP